MKPTRVATDAYTEPKLGSHATALMEYLETLTDDEIKNMMKISDNLTEEVRQKIADWRTADKHRAIEYFAGDIYTGLDAGSFSTADLNYAQQRLVIISGLYGVLRPLDLIAAYRLEMGYPLTMEGYNNLYSYWSGHMKSALPKSRAYINLTSEEYFKVVRPALFSDAKIVAPKFLTRGGNETKQVTIHSKVARGAYANWIIRNRLEGLERLTEFDGLGYKYDPSQSTGLQPVFVKEA